MCLQLSGPKQWTDQQTNIAVHRAMKQKMLLVCTWLMGVKQVIKHTGEEDKKQEVMTGEERGGGQERQVENTNINGCYKMHAA